MQKWNEQRQQERLRFYLEIINWLRPEDLVCQLEQELILLRDSPLTLLQEQEEKRKQGGDIGKGMHDKHR